MWCGARLEANLKNNDNIYFLPCPWIPELFIWSSAHVTRSRGLLPGQVEALEVIPGEAEAVEAGEARDRGSAGHGQDLQRGGTPRVVLAAAAAAATPAGRVPEQLSILVLGLRVGAARQLARPPAALLVAAVGITFGNLTNIIIITIN